MKAKISHKLLVPPTDLKLIAEISKRFDGISFDEINYGNFLRILQALRAKNYALKAEKAMQARRRKNLVLNHDKMLWEKASEYLGVK